MRPKLLDLFCGAGGCTKGYQQAGFYVVGVDHKEQPRYVGDEFIQADVMEWLPAAIDNGYTEQFDVIHASPPCQAYSMAAQQWRTNGKDYPDLLDDTRRLLLKAGKPYVIENVPGADLTEPLVLNGAFFGKNLRRTRHFETMPRLPFILLPPEPPSGFIMGRKPKPTDPVVPVGHFSGVKRAQEVMELPWMGQKELAQAIPPAYTEFIGRKMLELI